MINLRRTNIEDVEKIAEDPIVRQWLVMCLGSHAHAQVSGNATAKWLAGVDAFWNTNKERLESQGFERDSITESVRGIAKKITAECVDVSASKNENKIWIVKFGDKARPANSADILLAQKMLDELLDGIDGLRVIVTHNAFDSEVLTVPKP